MITTEWDIHTDKVPYSSDRWATSGRGWLFANKGYQRKDGASYGSDYVTLGHYLAYSPGYEGHTTDYVHAVSCVTRESSWHATPESAQASGRVASYFANEHRRAGGYQHTAEDIERMQVRA